MTSSATPGHTGDPAAQPLVVRTVRVDAETVPDLIDRLPHGDASTWLRRGEGLVGWGTAAQIRTTGPTRFADADKWWSEQVARALITDEVGEPGTGMVCFGSFAFADEPGDSVLSVPQVVFGRRGETAWLTTISSGDLDPFAAVVAPVAPAEVSFADGALNGEQWMSVVADAVARINRGDLEKVVLARDLVATADRADRPALAPAPAGDRLPDVLDLPRRRPVRRHPRDARTP